MRATYDKHRAGSKLVGIPRLKERTRPEAVDAALRWLGIAEVRASGGERATVNLASPVAVVAGDGAKATPRLISAQTLYERNEPVAPGLLKATHNSVEFLHSGLSILAARQKAGKSWLTLQIAIMLAGGRTIEGLKAFEQWRVLYGALEEPETRTASRLRKLAEQGGWLSNISFFYELLPLMGGGAEQLENLIDASQPQLMVLDTLTAVIRPFSVIL